MFTRTINLHINEDSRWRYNAKLASYLFCYLESVLFGSKISFCYEGIMFVCTLKHFGNQINSHVKAAERGL